MGRVPQHWDHIRHGRQETADKSRDLSAFVEVVCLKEPQKAEEDVARAIWEGTIKPLKTAGRLLDAGVHRGWGYDDDGQTVYDGRRCCVNVIEALNMAAEQGEIPKQMECPDCNTLYLLRRKGLLNG